MSVNKAILVGNVGNDSEAKNVGENKIAMTTFNMATNESYKDKDGKRQERTEWHKIVTFGKLAETCATYVKKGKEVYVEGKIRSRTYKDKENVEHKVFEIVADNVRFLGSKKTSDSPPETAIDDLEM